MLSLNRYEIQYVLYRRPFEKRSYNDNINHNNIHRASRPSSGITQVSVIIMLIKYERNCYKSTDGDSQRN